VGSFGRKREQVCHLHKTRWTLKKDGMKKYQKQDFDKEPVGCLFVTKYSSSQGWEKKVLKNGALGKFSSLFR
jgi:hypothetical protein